MTTLCHIRLSSEGYHPPFAGNVFEWRGLSFARQLYPDHAADMVWEYDQLLAKRPGRPDAVFPAHQVGRLKDIRKLQNNPILICIFDESESSNLNPNQGPIREKFDFF